jgi:hypothetical protein
MAGATQMKPSEMLAIYRETAAAPMKEIAAEFQFMSASDQRELLFWMIIDVTTNPTRIEHVERKPS